MNRQKLNPTAFCYPFSQRTEELDAELLNYFKILRWGSPDPNQWYYPATGNKVVCGGNIDFQINPQHTLDDVRQEMTQALRLNQVVVYYAHCVSESPVPVHALTYSELNSVCELAKELSLKFYTLSELAMPSRSFSSIPDVVIL
jgi:hypothetical protein